MRGSVKPPVRAARSREEGVGDGGDVVDATAGALTSPALLLLCWLSLL